MLRQRWLQGVLGLFIVLTVGVVVTAARYVRDPAPLADLLPAPVIEIAYAPHYLYSIYGVDEPLGIALSPAQDRIYVTETGGARLTKIFSLDGEELGSFAPPGSTPPTRAPVYVAVDDAGRVYVTDRLQHAVFVYDRDGNHLDTILAPQVSLATLASDSGCRGAERVIAVNIFARSATCREADGEEVDIQLPPLAAWSPLGIRFDGDGRAVVTDVTGEFHKVQVIPGGLPSAAAPAQLLGASIADSPDTLQFPNVAVAGPDGRIYVTDGNNGRIAIWDADGAFVGAFGRGTGDSALSLPRGAVLDGKDRLHVVDAVGHAVLVYNVSGSPDYLYRFGDVGVEDGQFNFPSDIAIDSSGRLYITDRASNRVQIWSY